METVREVRKYLELADKLKRNLDDMLAKGDLVKASEMLWGIFACYMSALRLLRTGRPARSHREIVETGYDLAKALRDSKVLGGIKAAEKCHANFYHGFLDEEEFKECYRQVMYVVRKAYELIQRLLGQRAGFNVG